MHGWGGKNRRRFSISNYFLARVCTRVIREFAHWIWDDVGGFTSSFSSSFLPPGVCLLLSNKILGKLSKYLNSILSLENRLLSVFCFPRVTRGEATKNFLKRNQRENRYRLPGLRVKRNISLSWRHDKEEEEGERFTANSTKIMDRPLCEGA